eukprot:CAMPEP_0184859116 /NCGR_PEP_ID=MMETSP0580-20130426/4148_1 /TAXON_ID=1118495 /ORGANISM="Dactyliosolen fragilissimus" /LENGTH=646 /DNA_ID=CAMNT_0027355587 /DNA_START=46 /DNA_END=1983 /DNA_ORIENTATION=+
MRFIINILLVLSLSCCLNKNNDNNLNYSYAFAFPYPRRSSSISSSISSISSTIISRISLNNRKKHNNHHHHRYHHRPISTTSASSTWMMPHDLGFMIDPNILHNNHNYLHDTINTNTNLLISNLNIDMNVNVNPNLHPNLNLNRERSEAIAGPFFGTSLFPYLLFLYYLNVPQNDHETPKGVTVGFATCLLFVFLTIPAAIAAQVLYGLSLADVDWLHGSAESLLTVTNLVTVLAFRRSLRQVDIYKEEKEVEELPSSISTYSSTSTSSSSTKKQRLVFKEGYGPMTQLVIGLTILSGLSAVLPNLILMGGQGFPPLDSHTPYLFGLMDLNHDMIIGTTTNNHILFPSSTEEPENALSILTWIVHVSSLVEFLVAMGFVWRWADVVNNPKWKGLTWGLLPLHTSGITACTYHLFYNRLPLLVPLQAMLTCIGNTTAAYAAFRIAVSNGWRWSEFSSRISQDDDNSNNNNNHNHNHNHNNKGESGGVVDAYEHMLDSLQEWTDRMEEEQDSITITTPLIQTQTQTQQLQSQIKVQSQPIQSETETETETQIETQTAPIGFEDLGEALSKDNDAIFLLKLFVGCALASYVIKYGELFVVGGTGTGTGTTNFFYENDVTSLIVSSLAFIVIPSLLNAFKWYKRSLDPTF